MDFDINHIKMLKSKAGDDKFNVVEEITYFFFQNLKYVCRIEANNVKYHTKSLKPVYYFAFTHDHFKLEWIH